MMQSPASVCSDVDIGDTDDLMDYQIPLDLSFKMATTCSHSPDDLQSPLGTVDALCELANLQNRLISTAVTAQKSSCYAEELHKVANGPSLSHSNNIPPKRSSTPPPDMPSLVSAANMMGSNELLAFYHCLPLQYQLAASQLVWQSTPSLSHAGHNSPTSLPNNRLPINGGKACFNHSSIKNAASKKTLNHLANQSSKLISSIQHVPSLSESLGISMRGNQKYSAFYQRPLITPNVQTKRGSGSTVPRTQLNKNYDTLRQTRFFDVKGSSNKGGNNKFLSNRKQHAVDGVIPFMSSAASKETTFQCSCGESFENLYIFALHMKESSHSPAKDTTEREIPKLVRGQDMWINSEVEQTREILRCIQCQQSFRTLPDLTMHMIKTNHYSEIVYSDSGRCVFVNGTNSDPSTPSHNKISGSSKRLHSNLSNKATKRNANMLSVSSCDENQTQYNQNAKNNLPESENVDVISPKKMRCDLDINTSNASISSENSPSLLYIDSASPIEKENVSITCDSPKLSHEIKTSEENSNTIKVMSEDDNMASPFKSVISQIESFVEKNLPRPSTMILSQSKRSHSISNNPTKDFKDNSIHNLDEGTKKDKQTYVAPEVHSETSTSKSNPLSSLEKFVEDARNVSVKSFIPKDTRVSTSLTPVTCDGPTSFDSSVQSFPASLSSPNSTLVPTSLETTSNIATPTVIMVNPTYIYQSPPQPSLDSLSLVYSAYPWLSSLVTSMGLGCNPSIDSSPLDLLFPSRLPLPDSYSCINKPPSTSKSCGDSTFDKCSPISNDTSSISTETVKNTNSGMSKKVKCTYCSKPFANKGQVRLHISKSKCPSLMQSTCLPWSLAKRFQF